MLLDALPTKRRLQPILVLAFAVFVFVAQSGFAQTNLCKAILARKSVNLSGDMLLDSFNSFDPTHSTNGRYDSSKRTDGADIASVSDTVTVITDTGNTRVYGHFATGPSGSVTISGNASVGSITWVDGGNRGIQPGWYATNFQAAIPDVSLPSLTFSTLKQTSGTVNGTNYSYVLTTGNYKSSSSFSLNGSMCINGNVVLYFQSGFQVTGQGLIYIAPNAKLTVYLGGPSTISGRGAINGTGNATNCTFYGLPSCTSLQNSGSSDFVGTIYAPEAALTLSGGGSQNVNFAGSVAANTVTISGNYQFHYDQGLCGGCSKPIVLSPPCNQTNCPGTTANFSVGANGIALTYQWFKNGGVLSGRTNNTLSLTNVSAADAATYSVVVSSPCGSVTNSASLTVSTLVSVAPLPNLVRFVGGIAVFTASASGSGPFAYVWAKDGNILSGQTGSGLVLTNLSTTNSGAYTVTVTGPCNSATASGTLTVDTCFPSVDVMLVIDRSGSMTGQPYNDARTACSNFVPNLHFTNNGDKCGLASYNSSATLDQKLTNSLAVLDQGIQSIPSPGGYTSISLGLLTAQSELASARRNTNALPVVILLSDGLPTAETKSNALYNATQVKYAGTRIFTVGFGAVDPNLLANVASSPGDFYYGTNSSQLSSLFTAIATIICRPPTNIVVTGPSNQTVCAGSSAIFSVAASGCDSFTYQWDKNGVRLPGQTNNSLVIPNASTNDAGVYSVEVHSICRSVTNSATLTVNRQVVVVSPPASLTNCPGTIARFSVSATGTALSYQWYRAGSVLPGQTTSSLSLTNVSATDAAVYRVVVSGACGNSVSNSASLTVTALPTISCPGNKTVQLGTPWNFDAPTANYPILVVSTVTNTAGHCGNTFDATRTWAAIDGCNNSAQCSQTVTVVDSTPPIINCSNTNKTVEIGTAWTFDTPTATDNGGTNITIMIVSTVTNTTGHCGNTFAATRTWAAIDACNNSAQCSQTVTVVDTTPPIINCSNTNKTVELGTPWTFDTPTATDNGGTNITIMVVSTVTNTAGHCGNTFAATRTWAAIDACNNSAQCSQTVTVVDTTPPIINCSNTNKTVELGTPWTFDTPTATDNGGTNITIMVVSTVTNTAGHCGNTFAATRTWAAIDACNNSAQCSQTVTVVDTTPPIIDCGNTNKIVELGTPWTFDTPTATDNSGTNITIMIVSTVTNTTGHCGNTFAATRTWAAIDACNNSAQCSQTVTVVDTTPPIINCSNTNKTVELGTPWTFDTPTATDNGGTNITIMVVSTVTNTAGHCGNTFAATRTWAAIDACNNSAQCSQTVTVVDTTPPIINCSNTNKTVELGTPWTFDTPTATDNGGTNITIMVVSTVTNTAGHCGNTFAATRTWAAIDACNNSAQCSQTVTVVDTTPPIIDCGNTNKIVELGTPWTFDTPTATDNSGTNITIMIVSTVTNTTGHCGNTFAATRTWAAIDACNNSAQCSQTVTVVDTTPPIIDCGNTNKTVELGTPWTFDTPTATDNSGTNITIMIVSTVTNTTGHCGNTFAATRTWAAIDACNNSAQCSQTVTVVDTTPPIIDCGNTNKTVELGTPWTFDTPTATDNSGTNITIMVVSTVTNTVGHCGNGFDAKRTWAAIDGCNNSAQCSQTVTVIDTTPIRVTTAPANQTNCFGTTANFGIVAQGTGLTYLWLHSGSVVGTNNTLAVDTSIAGQAGQYTVVVTDQCNDAVTNSANLVVNATTVASPLSSSTNNLGNSITLATLASGTGPFTYVWKKNGSVIARATTNSLTLTNLTFADDADYTVEVTGTCNTAVQSAHLTINHPPTVSIISPTNGTVFIAPATFTLAANAQDIDGIVTNITFFQANTNRLGDTTNSSPGVIFLTNQPVGSYTFTAIAQDNLGARGTSAPVSISIIAEPPLTIVSTIHLNPQTGLFEQTVRVFNPTYNSAYAVRVYVGGLTNGTTVYNASGVTNGVPYVQSHAAVPAGTYVDFVIEYYIPSRIIPTPTLHAQLVPVEAGGGTVAFGFPQHIDRGIWLPNQTFMVEFLTVSNRIYSVQYSSNLTTWRDAQPPITGNGTRIQWIDSGEPKTESLPSSQKARFYRVVLLP